MINYTVAEVNSDFDKPVLPTLQAQIYCPDNNYEILLADSAQTLAVRTVIQLSKLLRSEMKFCQNSDQLTNSKYIPLVRIPSQNKKVKGAILVSYKGICDFIKKRQLQKVLKANESGDAEILPIQFFDKNSANYIDEEIFLNLCNNFTLIELYINWVHHETFEQITSKRFAYNKSWPLDKILLERKRKEIVDYLKAKNIAQKSLKDIEEFFTETCEAFNDRLGNKIYFFSDYTPSKLDAMVFGHLFTLFTTKGVDNRFADIVNSFKKLRAFIENIEKEFRLSAFR